MKRYRVTLTAEERKELEQRQRKPDTLEDKIYRENIVDKGIDKYKTLKKIREGTGKLDINVLSSSLFFLSHWFS